MLVILLALAAAAVPAPAPSPYPAALVGEWRNVRTGEALLLWADGHYGERNIISRSEWVLEAPGRIRLDFCFATRLIEFHFERKELVVENSYEAGRYRRVAAVPKE